MVYGLPEKRARSQSFLFVLALLLFLSIVVSLLYFTLYGDFLKVRNIEISGTRSIPHDLLLGSLTAHVVGEGKFLSWLGPGNILFWKFSSSSLTSASVLPIVAEAVQSVDLRTRHVTLTIHEREGFGTWCAKDRDCYVFDREGVAFGKAPQSEGVLVINIEDQNAREPLLGFSLFPRPAWRDNFFATIQVLEDNNVSVSKIIVRDFSLREWEVVSALGFSFYFNLDFTPDNLDAVLKNLSKQLTLSSLSYLDFRVPNRVYYR